MRKQDIVGLATLLCPEAAGAHALRGNEAGTLCVTARAQRKGNVPGCAKTGRRASQDGAHAERGHQHSFIVGLATLMLLVGLTGAARAQPAAPQIEQVRVGLPAGSGDKESGRVRPGAWAPVYLKIKAGNANSPRDEYRVLIQATDAEDALYTYPVPLPSLEANKDHMAIGYLRPSNSASEIKVFLQTAKDGRTIQTFPKVVRDSGRETVAPTALLVLAVGARLTNLKNALDQPQKQAGQPQVNPGFPPKGPIPPQPGQNDQPPDQGFDDRDDEGGRRFAFIESVDKMPDQWFGYEAADVVVLTSKNKDFINALAEDQTHRREALLEWVRRGGRLILSVESSQAEVAKLLDKMPLLDCSLKGSVSLPRQGNLQSWIQADDSLKKLGKCVDVQPGPQTHVILRESDSKRPLLIQGACGLGRVILVGFDLDQAPFTEWRPAHLRMFWDKLLSEILQRPVKDFTGASIQQQRGQLLTDLQRGLETFDVPVIHFGWVTLFILVYILIVGPLDYFVLKKVFKRLELTWITFPTLVILISVLAYLIAYRVKGDGLRINKIDLVEYDLSNGQAYGRSWFSVFSPRIQKYTLGQEPVAPEWSGVPAGNQPAGAGTMLATLAIPTDFQRVGAHGLFPQPYAYAEDAEGVRGLPIAVWATRTFTTSWHAPLDPDRPAIAADLSHSRLGLHLPSGTITNNLPVELQGVTLFYEGRWYTFPADQKNLAAGESRRIDTLFGGDVQGKERPDWLHQPEVLGARVMIPEAGRGLARPLPAKDESNRVIKAALFHAETDNNERDNSGLRLLDQTWRLKPQLEAPPSAQPKYRSEIVLVARTPLVSGPAETLSQEPSSPTRLWLGELPGKGPRPPLSGQLTQETYVRIYLPIKSSEPK